MEMLIRQVRGTSFENVSLAPFISNVRIAVHLQQSDIFQQKLKTNRNPFADF